MINKTIKDVDSYLSKQEEGVRRKLEKIRQTIRKTVPDAVEVISYQMPAFKYHGMLAYFAAFTKHYSIFISPKIIAAYKDELEGYETSKGTIKIPKDRAVPVGLVTKIIKSAARQNLEKAEMKKQIKQKHK